MQPLVYIALVREEAPGAFSVFFPDVPEAITQGDTMDEAIVNAADALSAALEAYLSRGREWPVLTPLPEGAGETAIGVPVDPALAARALLANTMRAKRLSNVAVAELMGKDEKVVRRILAGQNASLDLTLDALRAVGVRPALAA